MLQQFFTYFIIPNFLRKVLFVGVGEGEIPPTPLLSSYDWTSNNIGTRPDNRRKTSLICSQNILESSKKGSK